MRVSFLAQSTSTPDKVPLQTPLTLVSVTHLHDDDGDDDDGDDDDDDDEYDDGDADDNGEGG